jgi:vacuolar-type H+-ATPase subunit E/Vma4
VSETTLKPLGDSRVDDLQRLVREQAAEEMRTLRAATEVRVADTRARAEAQVGTIRDAARRDGEEKGRREAAKVLAVAATESQQMWLRAREDLLDAAVHRVQVQLDEFRAIPEAGRILGRLLEEAVGALPPAPLRVRAPQGYAQLLDEEALTRICRDHCTLQFDVDAVPGGGVIVETIDGRLRFDNSFGERLRRKRHEVRRLLGQILISEVD